MHNILALFLIALCAWQLLQVARSPSPLNIFSGVLSLFTLAYYGLPMLLIERSPLRYLPENELSSTIFMALLYFLAMLIGLSRYFREKFVLIDKFSINFSEVDNFFVKNWWIGSILSNIIVFWYISSTKLTWYQFESVDDYMADSSAWSGFLAFFVGLIRAFSALYLAHAIRMRSIGKSAFAGFCILLQMGLVANAGQRLIFIQPAILVVGAFVVQRLYRESAIALGAGVLALALISPFAVALREGTWNNTQEIVAQNFSYGDKPIDKMLQSIVDRADILQSMAALKIHVDTKGHVGPAYYFSVFIIPVPRVLYPTKPAVLSDDGSIHTEASVLVWHLLVGPSTGSLTAFGAIVAYREGGWLWVPINGLITGGLFSLFLSGFARSGFVGQGFFCLAFFRWSVMKVPPSLMEMMVDVMTYLPVMLALFILNRFLQARHGSLFDGRMSNSLSSAPGDK